MCAYARFQYVSFLTAPFRRHECRKTAPFVDFAHLCAKAGVLAQWGLCASSRLYAAMCQKCLFLIQMLRESTFLFNLVN
jgi:hypothetical protein